MKKVRSKRKKAKTKGGCEYVVQITDWDLDYSLRLDPRHLISPGPYWEHAHLKINGKFVKPQTLFDKTIDITLLGDRNKTFAVERPLEVDWEPRAIGDLSITKSAIDCYIAIPFDALSLIAGCIENGKVRFISFFGDALYRNKSDIKAVSFEREYSPEEND